MEKSLEKEYETHFGRDLAEATETPEDIAQILTRISQQTGTKSALLWVMPRDTHLHLVLINPGEKPIVVDLDDVPLSLLEDTVEKFHREIEQLNYPMDLTTAQQLYQWIIEPLEEKYLQPAQIDTLLLCMGKGLRGLPIAALHDGEKFLVEKYSFSMIPAFNLITTEYNKLQKPRILAMGASEFEEQTNLPAVPVELSTVTTEIMEASEIAQPWRTRQFLNLRFTLENLELQLALRPFEIVHLATHAEFLPGNPNNSYIQFWNGKLNLSEMSNLRWSNLPELLVLSACKTAVGDSEAELGFAGLALQSGVKSALASLWYVSDAGTLALMSEFYRQLSLTRTKAEALRQAQILLLQGKVYFEGSNLFVSGRGMPLPDELSAQTDSNLSHPFYWAAFTMISSPW